MKLRLLMTALLLAMVVGAVQIVHVLTTPHVIVRRLQADRFRKREIASIVYLGGHGLPPGTMPALEAMHASVVYLYVAYYSDAYYSISRNPYGMAEPSNVLTAAIAQLHAQGIRVVAVISSALLDHLHTPSAGLRLLETPDRSVIDPLEGRAFVLSLVKSLLRYPVDGIYVGEPFWLVGLKEPPNEKQAFDALYQSILAMDRRARVQTYMVLPSTMVNSAGKVASGLPQNFTTLPFTTLGFDGEGAWDSPNIAHSEAYYRLILARLHGYAAGRPMTMEISLKKPYNAGYIPPAFLRYEVTQAKRHGVTTLLIFANEFWAKSPFRSQYASILRGFLLR